MNLIDDVKYELRKLVLSKIQLRKFGLTIGVVLLLISIFFFIKSGISTSIVILSTLGALLTIMGLLFPEQLKLFYQYWMLLAFSLGWIVSRIILAILFFFVLSPIGFLGKVFGKKFLDLEFGKRKNSYWNLKSSNSSDLRKMY